MSKAPLIYAELLLNIRQISIIVALDTPCDATTNVELSKDGGKFILNHKGTTTLLELPGQVTYSSQLQSPAIGSKELSWRLPLSGQPVRVDDIQNNEAPWSAASLTENDEFSCRDCGAVVVKREVVKTWKDLPSENWAEMMDFWHCHKPDVPHTNGSSDHPPVPDKGYGANTKFSADVGVGFVDLTTILLSDSDCTCIQHSPSPSLDTSTTPLQKAQYLPISCTSCNNYLGYHDAQAEGARFYKWRLTLSSALPIIPILSQPSVSVVLSAQLLSIVQSQCVSRILVMPHTDSTMNTKAEVLNLWVFAPSLRFSSSSSTPPLPHSHSPKPITNCPSSKLAMKIFYQRPSALEANTLIERGNIEELRLPAESLVELMSALQKSAHIIPPSSRKFREWDVGLLERYDGY